MAPFKEGGKDPYMGGEDDYLEDDFCSSGQNTYVDGDYYWEDELWSSGQDLYTSTEQAYHHQPIAGPSESKSKKDKGKSKDNDKDRSSHRKSKSSSSSSSTLKSRDKGKGKASSGGGNLPYPCGLCEQQFTHANLLNKHMNIHDLPYKCPRDDCPISKASSKEVLRHVWAAHRPFAEENGYQPIGAVCPDCERDFTRSDNLRQHIKDRRCKGKGVAEGA